MAAPPTGTVTFLFTDIEGSTQMWERDARGLQATLARHDEILNSAIESNGGFVFKTVGDAFCAAFSSAPEALGAAVSAQRALGDEEWEEGATIRVRAALHTGAVDERGGDYFGSALNRVSRLLSADLLVHEACSLEDSAEQAHAFVASQILSLPRVREKDPGGDADTAASDAIRPGGPGRRLTGLFDTLAAKRLMASQAVDEYREIHSLKRKRHRRVERSLRDGCHGVPRGDRPRVPPGGCLTPQAVAYLNVKRGSSTL